MALMPILTAQMRQSFGKMLNSYIPDWNKLEQQAKQVIKNQKPFTKAPWEQTDAYKRPIKGINHDLWEIPDGICLQKHPTLFEKLINLFLMILDFFLSPFRAIQRKIEELILALGSKLGQIGGILSIPLAILQMIFDFLTVYLVILFKSIRSPFSFIWAILTLPFWIIKTFFSRLIWALIAPLLAKILAQIQKTQQTLISLLAKYGWLRGILLGMIRSGHRPLLPILIPKKGVSEVLLKRKWGLFGSKTFLIIVEGDKLIEGFGEYFSLRMKQIFFPYYWERTVHMILLPKKDSEKIKTAVEEALKHDGSDEVLPKPPLEDDKAEPFLVNRRPSPASNTTQPPNICPQCNTAYDQSRKFCGKCGIPLVSAGTIPQTAPDISPSSEDEPQFPSAGATSSSKGPIIGIAAAIALIVIGYFGYDFFIAKRNFLGKIDSALSAGRYFSPPGDNVEEIFKAQRAKSPESKELKQAGEKIRVKFQQEGDSALQRFYNDSDDMGWENIVRMYSFLYEIIPEEREIKARAEFTKAHSIIKGGRRSDYSEALSRYQKALELKPNWVLAINGIAKVYVRKNSPFYNKSEALNYYNRACEVDPNFPWAYTNIAAIYAEDRNWEMAEQALQKALNLKKDRPSILIELGNLCEKQKKKQEAINYYQEALKYEKNPEKITWLQKKINSPIQISDRPISGNLETPSQNSPSEGAKFDHFPRKTTLTWNPVVGAKSYTVEVDCFQCCKENQWCSEVGGETRIARNLASTSYTFDWVGAQPGRWRVCAADSNGNLGNKSGWREFSYSR